MSSEIYEEDILDDDSLVLVDFLVKALSFEQNLVARMRVLNNIRSAAAGDSPAQLESLGKDHICQLLALGLTVDYRKYPTSVWDDIPQLFNNNHFGKLLAKALSGGGVKASEVYQRLGLLRLSSDIKPKPPLQVVLSKLARRVGSSAKQLEGSERIFVSSRPKGRYEILCRHMDEFDTMTLDGFVLNRLKDEIYSPEFSSSLYLVRVGEKGETTSYDPGSPEWIRYTKIGKTCFQFEVDESLCAKSTEQEFSPHFWSLRRILASDSMLALLAGGLQITTEVTYNPSPSSSSATGLVFPMEAIASLMGAQYLSIGGVEIIRGIVKGVIEHLRPTALEAIEIFYAQHPGFHETSSSEVSGLDGDEPQQLEATYGTTEDYVVSSPQVTIASGRPKKRPRHSAS